MDERSTRPRRTGRRLRPGRTGRDRPAAALAAGRGPPRPAHAEPAPDTARAGRGDRIAKLLARAGVASRRDAERLIAAGRVLLRGTPVTSPALRLPGLDGVTVDGAPAAAPGPARLFRFHKPPGFLVAARDPAGRPTIHDILPPPGTGGLPRLMPVGRLDMATEGLLLLTNDGALKRRLELPASGLVRTYRVRAHGRVSEAALDALAEGIVLDGRKTGPIEASIDRRARAGAANVWLTIRLTEGRNREVRRICEALGLRVARLIRTAYGPIELGDLPPRGLAEVPEEVVAGLLPRRKAAARSARAPERPASSAATGRSGGKAAPPPARKAGPA